MKLSTFNPHMFWLCPTSLIKMYLSLLLVLEDVFHYPKVSEHDSAPANKELSTRRAIAWKGNEILSTYSDNLEAKSFCGIGKSFILFSWHSKQILGFSALLFALFSIYASKDFIYKFRIKLFVSLFDPPYTMIRSPEQKYSILAPSIEYSFIVLIFTHVIYVGTYTHTYVFSSSEPPINKINFS